MSEHAAAVLDAFTRGQREQERMRTVRHEPVYNTRGTCTRCGIGKYEHERQDGR